MKSFVINGLEFKEKNSQFKNHQCFVSIDEKWQITQFDKNGDWFAMCIADKINLGLWRGKTPDDALKGSKLYINRIFDTLNKVVI